MTDRGDDVVGIVLHPSYKQKYGKEIGQSSRLDDKRIFDGSGLGKPEVIEMIRALEPEIGISVMFGYILKEEVLDLFPAGCINVHPSYLPFGKGAYPNIWCIVDKTPAGVSIHYVDSGIDTGDIIAQVEVPVEPYDTGASLYRRLEQVSLDLFRKYWPIIQSGKARRIVQEPGGGTFHRMKDVSLIDEIELNGLYKAGDLIDIIRARTYPPYRGAYFLVDDTKVYLRLQLMTEDMIAKENEDGAIY